MILNWKALSGSARKVEDNCGKRKAESGKRKAESRKQKAESRKQKAESRKQKLGLDKRIKCIIISLTANR